jgi:endo-1,4-beta-xylanase
MDVALTEPNVHTFIVWGYSDKTSWIPRVFPGYGDAHLYDFTLKPKPAYEAIKLRLQEGLKSPVKKK